MNELSSLGFRLWEKQLLHCYIVTLAKRKSAETSHCKRILHSSLFAQQRLVVLFAIAELAIDEAHQLHCGAEAESLVGGTEDVLVEDVSHSLLLQPEARDKLVIALQWRLVLQVHASHHGIHTLAVHLGEAEASLL